MRDIFTVVYRRLSRGLMNDDHITFALRLAFISLQMTDRAPVREELDYALRVRLPRISRARHHEGLSRSGGVWLGGVW